MIPFPLLERTVIDAALRFANLPKQPAPEDVEAVFAPIAIVSQAGEAQPRFKVIQGGAAAYENDRTELVGWLDKLRRWNRTSAREKSRVYAEIRTRLGGTVTGRAIWELTDDGALRAVVQPRLDGVQACYSFAAALLADGERWTRLHRCKLDRCRQWFWEPVVRAGPARQFCSDTHATAARKARMKKRQGKRR